MRNNRFPDYPDDTDYGTNAQSYYDDLARKNKLVELLAKKIWEYEEKLALTIEEVKQTLTDYMNKNDRALQEMLEKWDHRIDNLDAEVSHIFVEWLNDGTLEQIINHDVLGNKADQSELDITNTKLQKTVDHFEQMHLNVRDFGAIGDGVADDTLAIQDAINAIGADGGIVYFPQGIYGISSPINLINPTMKQRCQLVLQGKHMRNTIITPLNSDVTKVFNYDNGAIGYREYGTLSHSIGIKDMLIQGTGWSEKHGGTALHLNGCRDSVIENVFINRFNRGIYSNTGWMNKFTNVSINRCTEGLTVENQAYSSEFYKITLNMCGLENGDGYGFLLKNTGGMTITGLLLEMSKAPGLIIDNCAGVVVNGGNVESYPNNRSIIIRSSEYLNSTLPNNRTKGVKIVGLRFWDALGISVRRGVENVSIENCTWRFTAVEPTEYVCISHEAVADFYKYTRNIDYRNCYFPTGTAPKLHENTGDTAGYPIVSFTKDGIKKCSNEAVRNLPINTEAGVWETSQIVYSKDPWLSNCIGYVFVDWGGLKFRKFGQILPE